MSFEQSVTFSFTNECHQETANGFRWIDQVSAKEWLNEVAPIRQTFSLKTTWVKAINKSSI